MAYSEEHMEASLAGMAKNTENFLQTIDINTIFACYDNKDPIRIAQDTFLNVYESGVNKKTHKTMIKLFCGLFPELKFVKKFKKKILDIIKDDEYDFANIYEHILVDLIQ